MIDYSEKRDFIRMSVSCPIVLRDPSAELDDQAKLLDLSATGIRFISPRLLDQGAMLQVTLSPENPVTPPLEAEIAVIRCDEIEDGFETAATIETMAPAVYAEEA